MDDWNIGTNEMKGGPSMGEMEPVIQTDSENFFPIEDKELFDLYDSTELKYLSQMEEPVSLACPTQEHSEDISAEKNCEPIEAFLDSNPSKSLTNSDANPELPVDLAQFITDFTELYIPPNRGATTIKNTPTYESVLKTCPKEERVSSEKSKKSATRSVLKNKQAVEISTVTENFGDNVLLQKRDISALFSNFLRDNRENIFQSEGEDAGQSKRDVGRATGRPGGGAAAGSVRGKKSGAATAPGGGAQAGRGQKSGATTAPGDGAAAGSVIGQKSGAAAGRGQKSGATMAPGDGAAAGSVRGKKSGAATTPGDGATTGRGQNNGTATAPERGVTAPSGGRLNTNEANGNAAGNSRGGGGGDGDGKPGGKDVKKSNTKARKTIWEHAHSLGYILQYLKIETMMLKARVLQLEEIVGNSQTVVSFHAKLFEMAKVVEKGLEYINTLYVYEVGGRSPLSFEHIKQTMRESSISIQTYLLDIHQGTLHFQGISGVYGAQGGKMRPLLNDIRKNVATMHEFAVMLLNPS